MGCMLNIAQTCMNQAAEAELRAAVVLHATSQMGVNG